MQGQGWLVAAFWVIFSDITGLASDLMEKFASGVLPQPISTQGFWKLTTSLNSIPPM